MNRRRLPNSTSPPPDSSKNGFRWPENRGESLVELDHVRIVAAENLLMTTATRLPVKFIESEIHLLGEEPAADGAYTPLQEGESITIQPGQTAELRCVYQWHLSGGEPPMAAIL